MSRNESVGFLPVLRNLGGNRSPGRSPAKKRLITLTHDEQRFAVRGAAVLLGLALAGTGIWFGRKWYLAQKADREASQGLDAKSPASFASRIRLAIEGPGTAEKPLRAAFSEMASQEFFRSVVKSYQTQYGRNLVTDLQDDLSSSEYDEIMAIVNAKPRNQKEAADLARGIVTQAMIQGWTRRLMAAFEYKWMLIPSVDTDAVIKVFQEIPTRKAITLVGLYYQKTYGEELMARLKSELSGSDQDQLRRIYNSKP